MLQLLHKYYNNISNNKLLLTNLIKIIKMKKKNKSKSPYSYAFNIELEFCDWTSIPFFVIFILELYPKIANITIIIPTIKEIKALPKYFTATILLLVSFVFNSATSFPMYLALNYLR